MCTCQLFLLTFPRSLHYLHNLPNGNYSDVRTLYSLVATTILFFILGLTFFLEKIENSRRLNQVALFSQLSSRNWALTSHPSLPPHSKKKKKKIMARPQRNDVYANILSTMSVAQEETTLREWKLSFHLHPSAPCKPNNMVVLAWTAEIRHAWSCSSLPYSWCQSVVDTWIRQYPMAVRIIYIRRWRHL